MARWRKRVEFHISAANRFIAHAKLFIIAHCPIVRRNLSLSNFFRLQKYVCLTTDKSEKQFSGLPKTNRVTCWFYRRNIDFRLLQPVHCSHSTTPDGVTWIFNAAVTWQSARWGDCCVVWVSEPRTGFENSEWSWRLRSGRYQLHLNCSLTNARLGRSLWLTFHLKVSTRASVDKISSQFDRQLCKLFLKIQFNGMSIISADESSSNWQPLEGGKVWIPRDFLFNDAKWEM